ncbi:MAG: glycine dehydrogenase, partial [Desulfurococcaceae archaeon]|nr:glycine dehydrogenase [Desulfurococcaceae archaeon]
MPHPWIPNSYIKDLMLKELGASSILELFGDIPQELLLRRELNVGYGGPLPEYRLRRLFDDILSRNRFRYTIPPFLGGGMCLHYVPAVVKHLAGRSEFYTSYTPYQP